MPCPVLKKFHTRRERGIFRSTFTAAAIGTELKWRPARLCRRPAVRAGDSAALAGGGRYQLPACCFWPASGISTGYATGHFPDALNIKQSNVALVEGLLTGCFQEAWRGGDLDRSGDTDYQQFFRAGARPDAQHADNGAHFAPDVHCSPFSTLVGFLPTSSVLYAAGAWAHWISACPVRCEIERPCCRVWARGCIHSQRPASNLCAGQNCLGAPRPGCHLLRQDN